jgi:hypothetical protein
MSVFNTPEMEARLGGFGFAPLNLPAADAPVALEVPVDPDVPGPDDLEVPDDSEDRAVTVAFSLRAAALAEDLVFGRPIAAAEEVGAIVVHNDMVCFKYCNNRGDCVAMYGCDAGRKILLVVWTHSYCSTHGRRHCQMSTLSTKHGVANVVGIATTTLESMSVDDSDSCSNL